MRRSLPIVAFILAIALASPASAEEVADPDDVKGKLDLSLVVANKSDTDAPLRIRIETHENWAASLLSWKGKNRVWILFNVDNDTNIEYVGTITSAKGKLGLNIEGSGSAFETLRVSHPDGHTLKTKIPGDSPPNPEGTVRIAVRSRYKTKTGGCSEGCRDRAPNGGTLAVS